MKKNIYIFLIFFMVFTLSLLTSCNKQQISVDTDIEPSSVEFTVIKKIKQL